MNDVNPRERSIRNVPVAVRRRGPMPDPEFVHEPGGYHMPPPPPPVYRRHFRFWAWALGAVVVCAGLGVALSLLFTGARVEIVARTANVPPAGSITAERRTEASTPDEALGFLEIVATASTSRSVAASGTQNVNTTAQGTITIFNKYSESPQPLVATTRFESPTGKIYRIHESIVVPGGKKKADGTLSPGSVQVVVYADKAGPEYNTGAIQLSIPGFVKDKPKYDAFYATTEGLTGGASGLQPTVLPADAAKAKTDMQAELKHVLMEQLASNVPPGFVLIPDAFSVVYGEVGSQKGSGGNAILTESAKASAAIIKTSELAGSVAAAAVQGYAGQAVDFGDPAHLPLGLSADTPYTSGALTLDLILAEPVILVWQIDSAAIAAALAGKQKGQFDSLMEQFKPSVASAKSFLRPFWLSSFPSDASKITIKIMSAS